MTQTANEVHMPSDECSSCSPDSQNVAETDFDSAPTDQEAADAFTTCVRWLEHHGYPDVNFVCKMSELSSSSYVALVNFLLVSLPTNAIS